MTKSEGKRYGPAILVFFLAFTIICSLSAMAQVTRTATDKLLTNSTSNNNTRNATAVNCAAVDGSGNCTAGQYFHSDGVQYSPTWNTNWTTGLANPSGATGTVSGYGGWRTGAKGGDGNPDPSSPCISCHHGNPTAGPVEENGGSDIGGNYLVHGHKNMLRKVIPGKTPYDPEGLLLGPVDSAGNIYDWAGAKITPAGGSTTDLYYVYGWIDEPRTAYKGGTYTCARCHTSGFRPDVNGPEPTLYDASTAVSEGDLVRTPSGGTCSVLNPATNKPYTTRATCLAGGGVWPTSSWYLSGIQCERCHKADMQYDATAVNPTYNSGTSGAPVWTPTDGRVSHLVREFVDASKVDVASCADNGHGGLNCNVIPSPITAGDFIIPTVSPVGVTALPVPPTAVYSGRPLPNVPVGEKSTKLCIECHRQEVTYTPTTVPADPATLNLGAVYPAQLPGYENAVTVPAGVKLGAMTGFGHGAVVYTPGLGHGANGAQSFLNSPHARYSGTIEVNTQNSTDLSVKLNGTFNSWFNHEEEALGSKTGAYTGNSGCAGCHDVHNTLLPEVNATPLFTGVKECTECHTGNYAIKVVNHPTGTGTPFPSGFTGSESEGCVSCHMGAAGGVPTLHYFRINPSSTYNTYPSEAEYNAAGKGNQQPKTFVETGYGPNGPYSYNAVALDVDIACGQCHVGGNGTTNPYNIAKAVPGAQAYTRAALAVYAATMHGAQPMPPEFSLPGGTYPSSMLPLSVSLYTPTPGASIVYGAVASGPCTPSTPYSGPISVSSTTTICAKATLAPNPDSAVVSATYTIQLGQAGAPVFSPPGGTYNLKQTVSLSSPVSGATILYCLGAGCTPATTFTTGIEVSVNTVIRAQTTGTGFLPSNVVQASYNVVPDAPAFFTDNAGAPSTTPFNGGSFTTAQNVWIKAGDATMSIYYVVSTSGVIPNTTIQACATNPCPVTLSGRGYLRAIAAYTGGKSSAVATAVFYIDPLATQRPRSGRSGYTSGSTTSATGSSSAAGSSVTVSSPAAAPASSPQPTTQSVSPPQIRTVMPMIQVAVPIPVLVDESADPDKEKKDADKAEAKKEGKADATR